MTSSQDFLPVVSETSIPQKTFSDFVSALEEAWGVFSQNPGSLASGDPLLGIFQAASSQLTFVESLAAWIAAFARSTTSSGNALDSWMSQFSFSRLPAVAAISNTVLLSRSTPAVQPYPIPLGSVFQTSQGIQYALVADSTQTAYQSGGSGSYLMPLGASSIQVTVQALVAGESSNIAANTLNQLVTQITGVQTVNNPFAITSGSAAESDSAFRSRFVLFIQGLRQGVKALISNAIAGVQAGLQFVIVPNETIAGTTQYGYFYASIWPYTDALQAQVYEAVANAVADGIQFNIYSAVQVTAAIVVTIEVENGYLSSTVQTAVQAALANYVNGLVLGQPLYWSYLFDVIYAVPGVLNALNLTVNGGTSDIGASAPSIIRASSVNVNLLQSAA